MCDRHTRGESFYLTPTQEADPFVLVLIDGDGMIFADYFLRLGEEGGRQAANLLAKTVTEWMRANVNDYPAHCQIVTRVYANVRQVNMNSRVRNPSDLSQWTC